MATKTTTMSVSLITGFIMIRCFATSVLFYQSRLPFLPLVFVCCLNGLFSSELKASSVSDERRNIFKITSAVDLG